MAHSAVPGAITDASEILIEPGQSGGPNPHETERVETLLARQLKAAGFDTAVWSDVAALEVAILHPGRTPHREPPADQQLRQRPRSPSHHGWSRGHQFYDVWALLGRQNVLDLLADRPTTGEVLASCFEISLVFVPDKPLPHGGFAASTAFNPDGPLAGRLSTEHEIGMRDLCCGRTSRTTFDEVLDRVHASCALLDIEIAS